MFDAGDPDVVAAAVAWMTQHQITKCLRCGCGKIAVGLVAEFKEKLTGNPISVIPLVCTQCAHIELLSAPMAMGVLKPQL